MRTVTSPVAYKHTYKGIQPLNGKMMMFDFPVPRPTIYELVLEEGCSVQVTKEYYEKAKVGDIITTEVMELHEYLVILMFILFMVGVIAMLVQLF